jgi:Tol biopolymer transport system component
VLISEVSSASLDNAPTLSANELTMVFHSLRSGGPGGRDLWIAQRSTTTAPFDTPTLMTQVNSSSEEYGPSLSADGLELYFGSNRPGGSGDYDIWVAKRAAVGDAFASPVVLPAVNSTATDYFPILSADGLSLYFASTRSGGLGNHDTWVSTRADQTSAFPAPTNFADTNTSDDEIAIAMSADKLTFFIQSSRSGTLGGYDVWIASRSTTAQPFGATSNLTAVNSTSQDQATWLSPDGLRLYQSSDRGGSWSIYLSERSCND